MESEQLRCAECGDKDAPLFHYINTERDSQKTMLCGGCLLDKMDRVECGDCGVEGDLFLTDEGVLCEECIDEHFPYCPRCNERTVPESIQQIALDGTIVKYCPNCVDDLQIRLMRLANRIKP